MFHKIMTWVFTRLGVNDLALQATVEAFMISMYYTAAGMFTLLVLLMQSNGALNSLAAATAWLKINLWGFVVAQLLVPFLRAHAAANLYTPVPGPGDSPTTPGK